MAQLSSIFSALALLLAAVGIYGALSYAVARRTGEIGIRMALGACRSDVARMVVREALLVAAAGLAVGVPAALMASKLIGTFLFGVKPSNPIIVLTAIAVITAVACLAAYLPARRAARVDPMVALRYE
jgi:ABC-type antimicrobial peptide transport system permease subunit